METTIHFFLRNKNEHRIVTQNENNYRVWAMNGGHGKMHEGYEEYVTGIKAKGWREVDHRTYYDTIYKMERERRTTL